MLRLLILLTVCAAFGAASVTRCSKPSCRCALGKPYYWFDSRNNCNFGCKLGETLFSCNENEAFQHRNSCKNKPAPCECKVGKPMWGGKRPRCRFVCELEETQMSCKETEEYVSRTCQYLEKPCICGDMEPVWTGTPPHNCQFSCRDGDTLVTCDDIEKARNHRT